jgi:hypothetical protein
VRTGSKCVYVVRLCVASGVCACVLTLGRRSSDVIHELGRHAVAVVHELGRHAVEATEIHVGLPRVGVDVPLTIRVVLAHRHVDPERARDDLEHLWLVDLLLVGRLKQRRAHATGLLHELDLDG